MVFKIGKKILKLKSNLFYQYQSDTGFFYCHIFINTKKRWFINHLFLFKNLFHKPFHYITNILYNVMCC
nr:MAG TPA: hypothetical protein [Caudoviricetes sp.]